MLRMTFVGLVGLMGLTACPASSGDTDGPDTEGDGCILGDEDIVLDASALEPFAALELFEATSCLVTATGFSCAGEAIDVGSMFNRFAPVPWQEGQTVLLTPDIHFFVASALIVRSEDGDLLAGLRRR